MKLIMQDSRQHVLRFDRDEELVSGLAQYAKDNQIPGAYFSVIGTCIAPELGFYNAHLKDYRHKIILDEMEIVSLTGTVSWNGEEAVVHAHGSFANNDFEVHGGHVFKIPVGATCEVVLTIFEQQLNRQHDDESNLNLLA